MPPLKHRRRSRSVRKPTPSEQEGAAEAERAICAAEAEPTKQAGPPIEAAGTQASRANGPPASINSSAETDAAPPQTTDAAADEPWLAAAAAPLAVSPTGSSGVEERVEAIDTTSSHRYAARCRASRRIESSKAIRRSLWDARANRSLSLAAYDARVAYNRACGSSLTQSHCRQQHRHRHHK